MCAIPALVNAPTLHRDMFRARKATAKIACAAHPRIACHAELSLIISFFKFLCGMLQQSKAPAGNLRLIITCLAAACTALIVLGYGCGNWKGAMKSLLLCHWQCRGCSQGLEGCISTPAPLVKEPHPIFQGATWHWVPPQVELLYRRATEHQQEHQH